MLKIELVRQIFGAPLLETNRQIARRLNVSRGSVDRYRSLSIQDMEKLERDYADSIACRDISYNQRKADRAAPTLATCPECGHERFVINGKCVECRAWEFKRARKILGIHDPQR